MDLEEMKNLGAYPHEPFLNKNCKCCRCFSVNNYYLSDYEKIATAINFSELLATGIGNPIRFIFGLRWNYKNRVGENPYEALDKSCLFILLDADVIDANYAIEEACEAHT